MAEKIRTIYDLAKLAGVSGATVSRALAGKDVVNSKTAEKIRKLAADHGFRPSSIARNLRMQKKGAIGVVIPLGHDKTQHISDPFFMTLIGALADELTEKGFDLVLSRIIPDTDDWLNRMIDSDRVDGYIIIGQSNQSKTLDRVAQSYLPMVAWGAFAQGQIHCSVGTDNFLGGMLAASHLIDKGCKKLAFCGNTQAIEMALRLDGAKEAVKQSGKDVSLVETPTHLAAELSGTDIAAFLDSTDEMPDGIFAGSDLIALTAIQVLVGRGLSVPNDVRVIGFDDLLLAQTSVPTLTTIRQDITSGAKHLVECLLARINGAPTGSIVLNPELIQRAST
ncbi:LacI family DNA-binding transcriptional regulator [Altererythrobacter indicus]|uniref:LacI family DNA-binding transcriptional regulator n=1 Tax=Altericroceibacterium indicum TaxID=374177 RepID=A0A845A8Z7_9SPHN|nr:LacI family DNA-binding transcriptional regulator [Altericroceibacterium indicum]MXP26720.1 LacI family DNA-binding transcriptional regulator [Altericroceibacterium indicum]